MSVSCDSLSVRITNLLWGCGKKRVVESTSILHRDLYTVAPISTVAKVIVLEIECYPRTGLITQSE